LRRDRRVKEARDGNRSSTLSNMSTAIQKIIMVIHFGWMKWCYHLWNCTSDVCAFIAILSFDAAMLPFPTGAIEALSQ
jgi:hypothetical protein